MARLPYERRDNETDPAWQAFALYRDLGVERSLAEVGRRLDKTTALLGRWSSAHQWVKRVRAWDIEVDRRKRLADLRAIESMRERQTKIAIQLQDLGASELKKLAKRAAELERESGIDAKTIVQLIESGAKLERLNRGEPSDIVQQHGSNEIDPADLTTQELRDLKRIRAALAKRRLEAESGADVPEDDGE